jgi:hypothetical protein
MGAEAIYNCVRFQGFKADVVELVDTPS